MTTNVNQLADYFDRCAAQGAMRDFSDEEQGKIEHLLQRWALSPGQRVLEPGAGAGRLTARLAEAVGTDGAVLALDISPGMVAAARQRGLPSQVRFEVADATAVPAADDAFDVAICFHVFPHFADPLAALFEMARVLRPGGQLWVSHLKSREAINEFHRHVAPEVADHTIPADDRMRAMLSAAGFELQELSNSDEGYSLLAQRQ